MCRDLNPADITCPQPPTSRGDHSAGRPGGPAPRALIFRESGQRSHISVSLTVSHRVQSSASHIGCLCFPHKALYRTSRPGTTFCTLKGDCETRMMFWRSGGFELLRDSSRALSRFSLSENRKILRGGASPLENGEYRVSRGTISLNRALLGQAGLHGDSLCKNYGEMATLEVRKHRKT